MKYFGLLFFVSAGLLFSSCAKKDEYPVLVWGKDATVDYTTGECFDMQDKPILTSVTVKHFRETGQTAEEWICKNGKTDGAAKAYYESGKLYSETHYKNGGVIDVVKRYYESGQLQSERPYVNGQEEGVEKVYYESGKLQTEIPYKNGGVAGAIKSYYESGKLKSEIVTSNDKDIHVANEKIYFESGRLRQETICKGELAESCVEKNYSESGTLTSERAYTKGPE